MQRGFVQWSLLQKTKRKEGSESRVEVYCCWVFFGSVQWRTAHCLFSFIQPLLDNFAVTVFFMNPQSWNNSFMFWNRHLENKRRFVVAGTQSSGRCTKRLERSFKFLLRFLQEAVCFQHTTSRAHFQGRGFQCSGITWRSW